MSFNVATLQALEAEGLDLAACIRVLSTVEPKTDTAADKRRAWDRERKAEKRAEAKSGGMSGGNPPDPAPNERDNLTPTRKTKTEAKASSKSLIGPFVLPADIPAEPWAGWEDMRRKIRKIPTDHARSLAVAELRRLRDEEGWPPGEVLNHCTMNSYQGIFPPNRNRPNERSDRDPTTVAVERFLRGDVGPHAGTG